MPALSDPAGSRAVLVGVHTYEHLDQQLPAVANNLAALKGCLTDSEIWGLPQENVAVVPQPASASDVVDGVVDAVAAATDTVLFYYAGHGLLDRTYQELYLALPASRPDRFDTACRYEHVARHLRGAAHVPRVVVVLDCCYSGSALDTMSDGASTAQELGDLAEKAFARTPPGRTYCVLTASAATERALAPRNRTYTAYTEVLLTCLTEGIPDGPPLLDLETLHGRIRADLLHRPPTEDGQLPGTPDMSTPRGAPGQVRIARNRAVRQPSPAAAPQPAPSPVPRKPPSVPARIADLVRAYLTEQVHKERKEPDERHLYLVQERPMGESKTVRLAREAHLPALATSEKLIALWIWNPVRWARRQDSLAFTSHGIRVVDGSDRHFISYDNLPDYSFDIESRTVQRPEMVGDTMVVTDRFFHDLLITGPGLRWRCRGGGAPGFLPAPQTWLRRVQRIASGQ